MNKSMKGKNNRMTPNTKDDRWNERARSWQCGVVLVGGGIHSKGQTDIVNSLICRLSHVWCRLRSAELEVVFAAAHVLCTMLLCWG